MFEKLKSKIKAVPKPASPSVEYPSMPSPSYVADNPMFPTHPSVHKSNETIGFVLGVDFPKVEKTKKKGKGKLQTGAESIGESKN